MCFLLHHTPIRVDGVTVRKRSEVYRRGTGRLALVFASSPHTGPLPRSCRGSRSQGLAGELAHDDWSLPPVPGSVKEVFSTRAPALVKPDSSTGVVTVVDVGCQRTCDPLVLLVILALTVGVPEGVPLVRG